MVKNGIGLWRYCRNQTLKNAALYQKAVSPAVGTWKTISAEIAIREGCAWTSFGAKFRFNEQSIPSGL